MFTYWWNHSRTCLHHTFNFLCFKQTIKRTKLSVQVWCTMHTAGWLLQGLVVINFKLGRFDRSSLFYLRLPQTLCNPQPNTFQRFKFKRMSLNIHYAFDSPKWFYPKAIKSFTFFSLFSLNIHYWLEFLHLFSFSSANVNAKMPPDWKVHKVFSHSTRLLLLLLCEAKEENFLQHIE